MLRCTTFLYSFSCLGTFKLFPVSGYYEQSSSEHSWVMFPWYNAVSTLWVFVYEYLLSNHRTDFYSGYTSSCGLQQWGSVPLASHPHAHELSLALVSLVILTGIRWNYKEALICIPLMGKDVKHLFSSVSQSFEFPLLRILSLHLYLVFD